jgi:hypothetical protein
MKRGDFEAAAVDYSQLILSHRDDVSFLYNRGCAYEKLGKFDLVTHLHHSSYPVGNRRFLKCFED